MKNILFSALTLLFVGFSSFQANAQNDKASLLQYWDDIWKAYEANDEAKMWTAYDENASEVFPDGSHLTGLKALKAGYDQFKEMMDGQPHWTMTAPEITFFNANTAVLISDVTSDIKLKGGQQIGGKSKFAAVVQRQSANGPWKIIFDSQTPVVSMGN